MESEPCINNCKLRIRTQINSKGSNPSSRYSRKQNSLQNIKSNNLNRFRNKTNKHRHSLRRKYIEMINSNKVMRLRIINSRQLFNNLKSTKAIMKDKASNLTMVPKIKGSLGKQLISSFLRMNINKDSRASLSQEIILQSLHPLQPLLHLNVLKPPLQLFMRQVKNTIAHQRCKFKIINSKIFQTFRYRIMSSLRLARL